MYHKIRSIGTGWQSQISEHTTPKSITNPMKMYNWSMDIESYDHQVDINQRRLKLCFYAVEEVKKTLLEPIYPDQKADLLLASEDLCLATYELLELTRGLVWGESKPSRHGNIEED